MNNIAVKTLVLSVAFAVSFSGFAQEVANSGSEKAEKEEDVPTGQVLDKIVAKVDNNIILESDLQKAFLEAVARSQEGFEPPSKCDVFESMLVNKMMVAKAEIDSVIVTDAEVTIRTEQQFNMTMQQIGGEEEDLIKAYGKTAEQLKSEIFDAMKEQMVVGKMQETITQGLSLSPAEVRKFYENIPKDSLPFFSAEVSVGQIVKKPEVSEEEKQKVFDLLASIKQRILDGETDFATMARQYSEDPGSALNGGDLGFFNRGELAPEYEATALSLKLGEIGDPVESMFGIHLIQMLERKGNSFNTRHILVSPKPSEQDMLDAERFLDSIRTIIVSDSLPFSKAAKDFSDDRETSDNGGFFSDPATGSNRLTLRTLEDPVLYFTLDSMEVGTVTQPIRFEDVDPRNGRSEPAVRILYYHARYPAHRANLNDDYEKLKAATRRQKEAELLSNWFVLAKEEVFIDIDPQYDRCDLLQGD